MILFPVRWVRLPLTLSHAIAAGLILAVLPGAMPRMAHAQHATTASSSSTVTAPAASPTDGILLNFHDATLQTVLNHLSEVAGLTVVQAADMTGRLTVISRQPISISDAIEVLNSALKVNGLTAVRTGRVLKVIPLG